MKSQVMPKLAVAFLLLVFIFALSNLVYNIENLQLGGEERPVGNKNVVVYDMAAGNTTTTILRYMFYTVPVVMVVGIILGIFTFAVSKDKKKWKRLLAQIIGVLVMFLIVFAMVFFYEDIETAVNDSGVLATIGGGGNSNGTTNFSDNSTDISGVRVLMTFAIFAVGFGMVMLAVVGTLAISRMRAVKLKYDKTVQAKEVAETIQRAIQTMHDGSDARSTVIRCYAEMCRVMAKHGVSEEEHLTSREFEVLAGDNLPISKDHLHNLVMVFEEARYSDHEMSTEDSKRALGCLERVKEDLLKAVQKVEEEEDERV